MLAQSMAGSLSLAERTALSVPSWRVMAEIEL
jgi:hypothetical protein